MAYILIFLSLSFFSRPAWCQTTQTQTYQISVTIPETVTLANSANTAQVSNQKNFPQLVQTQRLVRHGRDLTVTSIVVR